MRLPSTQDIFLNVNSLMVTITVKIMRIMIMIAMIMFLISVITPVIINDNIILMAMLTMPFISS